MFIKIPFRYLFSLGLIISCCPETEPDIVPLSVSSLEVQQWDRARAVEADQVPIAIANYTLVLSTVTRGLENYQPQERRGFLRSPDCSDPPPEVFLETPVREIQVFTITDLTDTFPSGSEITSLFTTRLLNLNPLLDDPEIIQLDQIDIDALNTHIANRASVEQLRGQAPFRYYGLAFKNFELTNNLTPISIRVVLRLDDLMSIENQVSSVLEFP